MISDITERRKDSMLAVASLLQRACPDIFSVYSMDSKIILAYPISEPADEGVGSEGTNVWDRIIDELLRLCLHTLVSECIENKEEFIRNYISTFIKWK